MERLDKKDYLEKIIDETMKLPVHSQECILAAARAIHFEKNLISSINLHK